MPLPRTPRPGPPHSLTQRFLSPSRPRVPEEKDSAECPGPATEPGRDHVQPTRVPGDSQVSCRGSRPPPPSSVSHAGGRAPGPLQTPPGHRAQPYSLCTAEPRGPPLRGEETPPSPQEKRALSAVCLCLSTRFPSANEFGDPWSGGWEAGSSLRLSVLSEAFLPTSSVLPSFVTGGSLSVSFFMS